MRTHTQCERFSDGVNTLSVNNCDADEGGNAKLMMSLLIAVSFCALRECYGDSAIGARYDDRTATSARQQLEAEPPRTLI